MTEVRDWNKDMKLCEQTDGNNPWSRELLMAEQPDITIHWLKQYAAEKERADKASDTAAEWICKHKAEETRFQRQNRELAETKEREKKLREYIERIIKAEDILFHEPVRWRDTGSKLLATLYPVDKEEEAK